MKLIEDDHYQLLEIGEQRTIELDGENDEVVDEEDELENGDIVCEVVSAVANNQADVFSILSNIALNFDLTPCIHNLPPIPPHSSQ